MRKNLLYQAISICLNGDHWGKIINEKKQVYFKARYSSAEANADGLELSDADIIYLFHLLFIFIEFFNH